MDIDKSYERKVGIVERELGDKLFFLLWFATAIQITLVLWEWVNLVPALKTLVGISWAQEVKAIELSTTGYLIIQLAYMGKKEITRWLKRSESVLQPDEFIRRIRKGDVAVLIWGVLYLTAIICVALHIIERMPSELSRTFIQVTTLYTCAFVSKTAFKGRIKRETKPVADAVDEERAPAIEHNGTDREREFLKFIQEKGAVDISSCMDRFNIPKSTAHYTIRKMLAADMITRKGMGKRATYWINKPG